MTGTNPNPDLSDYSFGSYHPGGAQFVLCDGSVKMVKNSVDVLVYTYLGARDDKNHAQIPD